VWRGLDADTGDVFKVPQSGGPVTVLASAEPDLGRVAVKAQQVYHSTSIGIRGGPRVIHRALGERENIADHAQTTFLYHGPILA
jgi:hypothetical protein